MTRIRLVNGGAGSFLLFESVDDKTTLALVPIFSVESVVWIED